MAEPTLAQIFGTGTQRLASGETTPSAGLFIPDTALVSAGLATPSSASAEGHLAAVVINAGTYLNQTNFDANVDQSVLVADGFDSITTRTGVTGNQRTSQKTITFYKADSSTGLDPDDY